MIRRTAQHSSPDNSGRQRRRIGRQRNPATRLAPGGGQSGFVIRVVGNLGDVFDVLQCAVRSDHEHSTRQTAIKRAAVDEHAVVFTEFGAAVPTECLHVLDTLGSTPAFLPKRLLASTLASILEQLALLLLLSMVRLVSL